MRKLFVITIDTEVDRSQNWSVSNPVTFDSVIRGVPERLEPVFRRAGAKATYLLSPEVIENDECVAVLSKTANAEMGTHLHGEFIEPGRTCAPTPGAATHAMQCSYSEEVESAKLKNLTDLFVEKFGYRPTSFRAGRFGARSFSLRCLAELGYLVDTSVTPYAHWIDSYGSADHSRAPAYPYYPDPYDMSKPGSLPILEVPVSIQQNRIGQFMRQVGLGKFVPNFPLRVVHPTWIRPSFSDGPKMWATIRRLQDQNTAPVFVGNMMFHSMECIPGASPYCAKETDCQRFLDSISFLLDKCARAGFEFVTLSEVPSMLGLKSQAA